MTPLRDVTIAARIPAGLRTDLEALVEERQRRGDTRTDGGPVDLSTIIRRACAAYVDVNLNGARRGTLEELGHRPRSHRGGPRTEQEAAEGVWPRAGGDRRRVLEVLREAGERGCTGDELDVALDDGPIVNTRVYAGRRRLSELKAAGWAEVKRELVDTEERIGYVPVRRNTRAGHPAEVYVLTPAARIRLREEAEQL